MAYATLVNRYQDSVYNLAYRLCGNRTTAEDLAQETFIRAYKRLSQFRQDGVFRNWLLGICGHLARSFHRTRFRRQQREEAYIKETVEHGGNASNTTPERLDVEAALMKLPTSLRVPIVLKYMEGLSLEEIAATLGLRLSAVKMRIQRGRRQMANALQEDTR